MTKDAEKTAINTTSMNVTESNTSLRIDLNPNNKSITAEKTIDKTIGAKKRGFIVFGSLGLMVIAYIAYKKYR